MQDNAKPIRTLATIALILQAVFTALATTLRLRPEPLLALGSAPVDMLEDAAVLSHPIMLIPPLLRLAVIGTFCFLLIRQSKQPTAFSLPLLIMLLAAPVIFFLSSGVISFLQQRFIVLFYSSAELASVGVFNSLASWTSLLTAPVLPMLTAAAGMNWYRFRREGIEVPPADL